MGTMSRDNPIRPFDKTRRSSSDRHRMVIDRSDAPGDLAGTMAKLSTGEPGQAAQELGLSIMRSCPTCPLQSSPEVSGLLLTGKV
ncbi:hypothetical protein BDW68DRAFT_166327 [Aspergillus falconensis]